MGEEWKGGGPEAKALDDRLWGEDSGLERERFCRETIRRAEAHGRAEAIAEMGGLRERLAALAHEQWSGWMRHMFAPETDAIRRVHSSGARFMRDWAVKRWHRQMTTPYTELPDGEKESDRKEADRVLALLADAIERGEVEP